MYRFFLFVAPIIDMETENIFANILETEQWSCCVDEIQLELLYFKHHNRLSEAWGVVLRGILTLYMSYLYLMDHLV